VRQAPPAGWNPPRLVTFGLAQLFSMTDTRRRTHSRLEGLGGTAVKARLVPYFGLSEMRSALVAATRPRMACPGPFAPGPLHRASTESNVP